MVSPPVLAANCAAEMPAISVGGVDFFSSPELL
jgi:hypothetical protein